ncbi:MAG: DUF3137 domain-containing protein [Litorimonas sp.]
MRSKLYDLLGYTYSAVSPSPGAMLLLRAAGMVTSPDGLFRCRGRVRGVGFDRKRFSVQEVRSRASDDAAGGFDGLIVSVSHSLPIHGRTVVLPDRGVLNPRHVDGMKRVGFPSRVFEAAFEVYSDDQVEGRTLVPPDFMERLLAFDPILAFGKGSVAFAGRQMHVVLPTGDLLRFSNDLHFNTMEEAAQHIAAEMIQVFGMIAQVDALHSSADRHCPVERVRARDDYYASAAQSIEPAVMAALEAGLIQNDRRAKYLTSQAYLVDPAFRQLLLPRV